MQKKLWEIAKTHKLPIHSTKSTIILHILNNNNPYNNYHNKEKIWNIKIYNKGMSSKLYTFPLTHSQNTLPTYSIIALQTPTFIPTHKLH
jgi:hypothetical protein